MIGIYKFTNRTNRKSYIGQSIDINKRRNYYKYKPNKKSRHSFHSIFYNNQEDFDFEIIEICSIEELDDREIFWIKELNTLSPNGYNLHPGGSSNIGESNGRSVLTEKEVLFMRELYEKNLSKQDSYEEFFSHVSWRAFEKAWSGENWSHIRPDIIEKNKEYYLTRAKSLKGEKNGISKISDEEVLCIRERYVNETIASMYKDYSHIYSYSGFENMVHGGTYKHVPIYKKRSKKWVYQK